MSVTIGKYTYIDAYVDWVNVNRAMLYCTKQGLGKFGLVLTISGFFSTIKNKKNKRFNRLLTMWNLIRAGLPLIK